MSLKVALSILLLYVAAPVATVLAAVPVKTVLLVGDSLSSAHHVPVESGWVSLLDRKLHATTAKPPAIVDASRGGKTMTDALTELPGLLAAHHPQAVILELGGNDAIVGAGDAQLRQNLSRLIDMARDAGARVAVLGFTIPPKLDRDGCADRLSKVYREVARDKHVALLPSLMAGVSDTPGLLLEDGVHPNLDGQARVLKNAWPMLEPFLLH